MSRRERMLQDLDQEIHDHIDMATQDYIDSGMPAEEARHAALRKFGNVTQAKENVREVWSIVWFEQLIRDIRFALHILRKNALVTVLARAGPPRG